MKIKLVQPKKPVKAGLAVLSSVKYYNFGNFLRHQIYLAESMVVWTSKTNVKSLSAFKYDRF
jgi:hypothetical protein